MDKMRPSSHTGCWLSTQRCRMSMRRGHDKHFEYRSALPLVDLLVERYRSCCWDWTSVVCSVQFECEQFLEQCYKFGRVFNQAVNCDRCRFDFLKNSCDCIGERSCGHQH